MIDLPEEVTDEASFEQSDAERAQLLAEEEALELSKKPLDEILRIGVPESLLGQEVDPDSEDGVAPEPAVEALSEDIDEPAVGSDPEEPVAGQ